MAKLYFYYSAMNAGKSTLLLQSAHNYRERNLDVLILMPNVNTRERFGTISSRIGLTAPAIMISTNENLYNLIKSEITKNNNTACILVDEAQFLTKTQVFQLASIVDKLKIPVLCYGIRSDFRSEPFEGSMYLLTLADHLIELKTICHCGSKAIMNMRIDNNGNAIKEGDQILIGGNERYIATCRYHFSMNDTGKKITQPEQQQTNALIK
jgi:thymidine kinase